MPDVTVDPNEYERFELKTAPPDGFVMLRPLPYGKKLTRRDKATKMQMRAQTDNRGRVTNNEQVIELDTLNEWAVAYDFVYCIGEHNLTNHGQPLDFNDPKVITMTLGMLDPKVGSEIERYISDLNGDEDEEQSEDFTKRATSFSPDHSTSQMGLNVQETPTEVPAIPTT